MLRRFFKNKQWEIICIASQWIGVLIISLPFVFTTERVRFLVFKYSFGLIVKEKARIIKLLHV